MTFRYMAFDPDGNRRSGRLEVDSEAVAERILWERGLTVIDLQQGRSPIDFARWFPTFLGPRRRDVIIFTEQLANLTGSGVGIVSALRLLADEVSSGPLQRVLQKVVEDVRQGTSLSDALAAHESTFSDLYCRMIEVGERTGNLDYVLRQLATYMQKEMEIARKIRGASTYPAFLLIMAAVVVAIIMNVTLPPLLSLYEEFDATLPWTTELLISFATFFIENRVALFAGTSILIVAVAWYVSTERGRRNFHRLVLKIPLVRRVTIHGAVARLSRSLSALLQAGVALPESLELAREVVGNVILREAVTDLRRDAIQGRGLSDPIEISGVFPRMMAQMIRVGEETGTLDSHLATLADFYSEEVDRSMQVVTGVLEPALIIFVGLVVGFVALSVIMPMYSLLQAIR